MQREVINSLCERLIREFMNILILMKTREGEISGYELLSYFHKRFDYMVSPGTVYSGLYSLERDGLIEGRETDRKRIYTSTPKGKATIKAIDDSNELLEDFFERILKGG